MSRRIRLLVAVADLAGGGTERVFSNLLRWLPRERFDIHLCVWRRVFDYPIPEDLPLHVLDKNKPHHVFRTIRRTRHLVERLRPDLVLSAHYFNNLVMGEALAKIPRRPRWVCRLGNAPQREMRGLLKVWARRVLHRADRVIGNSRGVMQASIEYLGLAPQKVELIPNLVDLERIEELAGEELPFERPHGTFVVIQAARFERQKNQQLLLRSFARMRHSTAELWMLGKGSLEHELKAEAARLGLSDRVRWLGFKSNPYPFIGSANCFALSSDWEGMPNSVIEAMACGTPVVSTRCPYGPDELIADGEDGLLVPVDDVGAMTEAFDRLASDPHLVRRLGENAGLSVRQRFDSEKCVGQYVSLFETLAS